MQAPRRNGKAIEFKDGTLAAMTAVVFHADVMKLADAMHALLGGTGEFFGGEATIIDVGQAGELPERFDWPGLTSLLRRYGLQPVAVKNLPAGREDGPRKAGLAILGPGADAPPKPRAEAPPPPAAPEPVAAPAAAPAVVVPESIASGTLFVDRPLRSGQQVYARGGDLVILGSVSHGAEVIADGSIHCYGPLRGRAIAGAQGNTAARIFTTSLGPELVSIAGVFRTFERGLPAELAGRAAQIRLVGEHDAAQLKIDPVPLS